MKAEDTKVSKLLEGPKQFIVPIFQRDYSWGTKHCSQLWKDILRVGSDENAKAHFIGSVVYIAAEEGGASIARWTLIDGQQRLTTLTLLLIAVRNQLISEESDSNNFDEDNDSSTMSSTEISDYYLLNSHGKGDRRQKLRLRSSDQETLEALLLDPDTDDYPVYPKDFSENMRRNFEFFVDNIRSTEISIVINGFRKLVEVDVNLKRGEDDPQLIFESLNSTGMDLTDADLIRNFVLMRQEEERQTYLYSTYWKPIEKSFGSGSRKEFDKFVRDYLTLRLKPSKHLKSSEIYQHFRIFYATAIRIESIDDILGEIRRFGSYFANYSLLKEEDTRLRAAFRHLRELSDVATPLVLKLYDCYARLETLTKTEFHESIELLESYVFRRSICSLQTRNLARIFNSLAYRINENSPLLSLKVALARQSNRRRFPNDIEFREAMESRDIYSMGNTLYLLDRLENSSKEKIDTSTFTIEHVMPQNEELRPEWRKMLGKDWKIIQETWLHRLGNLTLTGYNSEYSDRPFEKKKTIKGGFDDSPLRLNRKMKETNKWTPTEMEARGKELSKKAVSIWQPLKVDKAAVLAADLEERIAQAAKYKFEDIIFDLKARELFDLLRPRILALGDDVVELCWSNSITYRVFDYFVEVIPRKKRLLLVLNLDLDDCDDPSGIASDATEWAFITHAQEIGGVLFDIKERLQIEDAINVIQQAYTKVSE